MQTSYVKALYELIKKDQNVISCLSDSGTDYDELIAREFPSQVVNFGISENNQVAAAAGLASYGKIPFVYTTNAFIAYRSYEFVRDDVCLQNQNVKLVGMGCGLNWSTLGSTHHTTEDIAALKVLPNLTILSPASPKELEAAVAAAYEISGPVYIRMGMSNEQEIFNGPVNFKVGKNQVIKRGTTAAVFVTGSIISAVLDAAEQLKKSGITLQVINVSTIKPFDEASMVNCCKKYHNIISVEEHSIIGGLGSSIADIIATKNLSAKLTKIGLADAFAKGYGTHDEVLAANGLSTKDIAQKIKQACATV